MIQTEITWIVHADARTDVAKIRNEVGGDSYESTKSDIQRILTSYFNSVPGCIGTLGNTIRPLGATSDGGKILKVRAALPGMGKSGGIRLEVAAYCKELRVVILTADKRRDL